MARLFHPEAERELGDAADFYEAARGGYGARFASEIERTLRLIEAAPLAGSRWRDGPARVWRTRRFPYLVVYVERAERLIVIAIAHTKRRPGYWQDRL